MAVFVRFNVVDKMLSDCAPSSTVRVATHARILKYNGKLYRKMPKHDEVRLG